MHILLTGATGLLGQGVLNACLDAADVTRVTVLTRSAIDRPHPKLHEVRLEDFAQAATVAPQLADIDACFYCAGAPPIGTAEATYRHVTLDLTLAVARAYASANPQGRFFYISGANSDPDSRLMPLRIKGETEVALQALPISTVMVRPGGILPEEGTHSPHGLLRAMHTLAAPLQSLIVKNVPAAATTNGAIGRAMISLVRTPNPPRVVENREVNALGSPH